MSTFVGGEHDLRSLAAIVSREAMTSPKKGCRCHY
jgi:hypothetical protein